MAGRVQAKSRTFIENRMSKRTWVRAKSEILTETRTDLPG